MKKKLENNIFCDCGMDMWLVKVRPKKDAPVGFKSSSSF